MPKVEIFNGEWTRSGVEADKERLYLFGDNLQDMVSGYVPTKTQAIIRGLPNALGIPTKKTRGYDDAAYFWDTEGDWTLFKSKVDEAINIAKRRCELYGHTIVVPSAGIGTGRATTRGAFSKPGSRFKKYLDAALASLGEATVPKDLIRLVNMKYYAAMPGERLFRIDRQSPIGNPFFMRNQGDFERDRVCDEYESHFSTRVSKGDTDFMKYLNTMLDVLKKGQRVALGCWCVPLRCHGLTIKAWLEAQLTVAGQDTRKDTYVEAIINQVRETGEWIVETRAGIIVEALRYGSISSGTPESFYVYHPGHASFSLSDQSARRYVEKHRK